MAYVCPSTLLTRSNIFPLMEQCSGKLTVDSVPAALPAAMIVAEVMRVSGYLNWRRSVAHARRATPVAGLVSDRVFGLASPHANAQMTPRTIDNGCVNCRIR